ncbi:MAG: DUF5050 domain-containing protein [Firmicutes bacterium]|nr:DUF5050 domain-containing protein [Bacillota bacterium]
MVKKILIAVVCLVMVTAVLVACSEGFKWGSVTTSIAQNAEIEGNGGLAVRVGGYLYFINGYAGNDADNTSGNVIKGAICRVKINEAGVIDDSKIETIVHKNVFHKSSEQGIQISGGYIYYTTPSVDKDKNGNLRINEAVLMRTKLNGSDTEEIKVFKDDFQTTFKVIGNRLIYADGSRLREINLSAKGFPERTVDSDVSNITIPKFEEKYALNAPHALADTIFYTKQTTEKNATNNEIWAYRASTGVKKCVVKGNKDSYGEFLFTEDTSLTFQLVETVFLSGGKICLVYTREDAGTFKSTRATFSFTFDDKFEFDAEKEEQYTLNDKAFTNFHFLSDNYAIVSESGTIRLIKKGAEIWEEIKLPETSGIIPSSAFATIIKIDAGETESGKVIIDYLSSDKVFRLHVLNIDGEDFAPVYNQTREIFTGSVFTNWLKMQRIGNNYYFFNRNLLNYAYYATPNTDSELAKPKLLSKIDPADWEAVLNA